jgi:hypothetical protein
VKLERFYFFATPGGSYTEPSSCCKESGCKNGHILAARLTQLSDFKFEI